jgi:hypothetical protein
MQRVNGKLIIEVQQDGVSGHLLRARSGVKLMAFYGADSYERALAYALGENG